MNKIYEGFLKLNSNGEEDDILFLNDNILTEELCELSNRCATVKYFVSNKKVTLAEAQEYFVRELYGDININYEMIYSEYTGYLWTNEELEVGGHDILEELKSYEGKYLILIADIDDHIILYGKRR